MSYTTKDSGERVEFASGMRRDTDKGKPRYDLIPLMPLRRLAELYARGAEKYDANNWQSADSHVELARFKASMLRHVYQALDGDRSEDHWAAITWNCFAVMWLEDKLESAGDSEMERLLAEEEEIERHYQERHAPTRFEVNEGAFKSWAARQRELSRVDL